MSASFNCFLYNERPVWRRECCWFAFTCDVRGKFQLKFLIRRAILFYKAMESFKAVSAVSKLFRQFKTK